MCWVLLFSTLNSYCEYFIPASCVSMRLQRCDLRCPTATTYDILRSSSEFSSSVPELGTPLQILPRGPPLSFNLYHRCLLIYAVVIIKTILNRTHPYISTASRSPSPSLTRHSPGRGWWGDCKKKVEMIYKKWFCVGAFNKTFVSLF